MRISRKTGISIGLLSIFTVAFIGGILFRTHLGVSFWVKAQAPEVQLSNDLQMHFETLDDECGEHSTKECHIRFVTTVTEIEAILFELKASLQELTNLPKEPETLTFGTDLSKRKLVDFS